MPSLLVLSASAIAAETEVAEIEADTGHDGNIMYRPLLDEYKLKGIEETVPAVEVERSASTALCGKCHADAVAQLKNSVHFLGQGPNPRILFPGGGAHGALDRACGLPGTTGLINFNS
ncbi:MAG: hypothetical protein U9Q81_15005, partial [Pseudomonadota bacterium]|nr:hypothetical protein [Pseudomonadota bacterium]